MAKRTARKPQAVDTMMGAAEAQGVPADGVLATIFASIRSGGVAPWTLEELPADTGASEVLLSELDRLWQNPLN